MSLLCCRFRLDQTDENAGFYQESYMRETMREFALAPYFELCFAAIYHVCGNVSRCVNPKCHVQKGPVSLSYSSTH